MGSSHTKYGMNDVADQYKETEDRKAELRIFKVKEAPNYDTDARENARIARIEGSPELEERSSVREIAQHFGALHEPLFAAKVRTFADDESTRVASSIKVSSLQLRPELHQTNVSGTDSASSPSGVKCAEQFSDHGGDHLSLNKAILSSPTTIDISPKAVGTVDASADHSQLPTSIETQISQPTAASNGHAVEGDTRRSPERIASQAITNPSVAADKKSGSSGDEGGELPQAKSNTTSNVSVTDGHDLCNDEYNQVVQFATHSNVSKLLYNITNIRTTTAASNGHQTTKPDVDACKESVSSAGLTETSDSCALVGSAQTDVESNADNTRDDNPEKKMASDEVVAQKVIATDASAAHPSRSGQVAQEAPRVQTVVMKKKRSNECFADAKVDGSHSKSSAKESKAESKAFIINDRQTAAVSATVSLVRSNKLCPQKNAKCSQATSSAVATFATPSQPVTVQKPMFANFASTLTSRPVLIVHPAKTSFSQTAIRSYKTFSFGEPSLTLDNSSAVASDYIESDLTNKTAEKPELQLESSTPNSAVSRVSHSSGDSKESSSNRLSKGFLDFTQGSSDRLQRWKSKLQTGRRHKDTSEPPPLIRNMPAVQEPSGHSSDAEIVLDWTHSKFVPLHPSVSERFDASNKSTFVTQIMRPRVLHPAVSATDILRTTDADKDVSLTDSEMERRTFKRRDNDSSASATNLTMHYHNIMNLEHLVQTVEGYDNIANNNLPPPVRITPYSGMKPQDSDIIRPVAFRPFVGKKPETTRQSITSNSSYFYAKHGAEQPNECQSGVDQFKRTSHFAEVSSVTSPSSRPHPIYQPSTSAGPSSLPGQQYLSKLSKSGKEENDYDVVPEYIDRDKLSADGQSVDSGSSDNYSILYQAPLQGGRAHLQQRSAPSRPNKSTFTTFPVGNVNLPTTIAKKSPSSHHVCGSNTSSGSRNSSGVHITPSPSDSGIVDYESIIRDKESELTTVRNTMEQNEEVIIRVYQEKERVWKEHLADLKQKLQASQQGENALRQQIQRCNEQRDQFQATIQNLSSDKQGLQRKCLQIEREMFEIRERFGELLRARDSACESCKRQSSNVDGDRRARPPPLPMPRQKETSGMDRDLRVEVEQLRSEISTLRDMLNEQIGLFSDERKRWEIERNKMISSNNIRATGTTEARVAVDSRAPLSGTQCIVSGDRLI